jgi:hypothetical protein
MHSTPMAETDVAHARRPDTIREQHFILTALLILYTTIVPIAPIRKREFGQSKTQRAADRRPGRVDDRRSHRG